MSSPSIGKMESRDLRSWIDEVEKLGELARINGADWDVEIGAITELGHHRGEQSKAILFDQIKGYPEGYRVLSNTLNTVKRIAATLHMDTNYTRLDFIKDIKRHITEVDYIKPEVVKDAPVMENVFEGKDIDMWKFPTPKWHELDGGRYIGTGSVDITVEPDEGWVNLGTYRVMIQNEDTLGFYISPGKQGRIMREKYFARGQSCKVAVSFGQDPLLYLAGGIEVPRGVSEYDWVGGLQGSPVPVIIGEYTGLPIPASAEIVVECEAIAGEEMDEGPFGEWTGYYASSMRPEPIMKVKRLYHRHDPVILGAPPTRRAARFYYRSSFCWLIVFSYKFSDPEIDIETIRRSWSGPLDPIIPKGQKGHSSRAVIDACRPYEWMSEFPPVAESSPEVRRAAEEKWGKILDE